MSEEPSDVRAVTRVLQRMEAGEAEARNELLQLVHADLLHVARGRMAGRVGETLQATALVNEAWLRLEGGSSSWRDRRHFLTAAAQAMRHILVDHARPKSTRKRSARRVDLELVEGVEIQYDAAGLDLLALDEQIEALRAVDARLAQIVELRFFAGLQHQEIAGLLDVTTRTVGRRWQPARGWPRERMEPPAP